MSPAESPPSTLCWVLSTAVLSAVAAVCVGGGGPAPVLRLAASGQLVMASCVWLAGWLAGCTAECSVGEDQMCVPLQVHVYMCYAPVACVCVCVCVCV